MALFEFSGSQLFGIGFAGLAVIVLAISARYIWRASSVRRAITVSSLIEPAPGTLVRASGTAHQGSADLLTAPFSGLDCLALRYSIKERRLSPALLPWFVTIHEIAGSDTFTVQTSDAEIDVVTPARTVTFERHVVATVPSNEVPPERIARFERQIAAIPSTTLWRKPPSILQPLVTALSLGSRRYTEERATPGSEVTVVGRVTDTGGSIDPLVVSDQPLFTTLVRMAKTSLIGLSIGAFSLALGIALFLLG